MSVLPPLILLLLAATPTARLVVHDPSGACLDEAALRARTAARLGFDPFQEESGLELHVETVSGAVQTATITASREGRPSGVRRVAAPSCAQLSESVAVALALVIDSVAVPVPAPRAARPPPPSPPVMSSPPIPREPLVKGGAVSLSGFANPGVLPAAGWGFELAGRLVGGRWSVGLEGSLYVPVTARLSQGSVAITAGSLGLHGCGHASLLEFCLVVRGGLAWLRGESLRESEQSAAPLAAAGARVGVSWPPTGRWFVLGAAEVALTLNRVSLLVGDEEVWSSGLVSGRFLTGAGLRF